MTSINGHINDISYSFNAAAPITSVSEKITINSAPAGSISEFYWALAAWMNDAKGSLAYCGVLPYGEAYGSTVAPNGADNFACWNATGATAVASGSLTNYFNNSSGGDVGQGYRIVNDMPVAAGDSFTITMAFDPGSSNLHEYVTNNLTNVTTDIGYVTAPGTSFTSVDAFFEYYGSVSASQMPATDVTITNIVANGNIPGSMTGINFGRTNITNGLNYISEYGNSYDETATGNGSNLTPPSVHLGGANEGITAQGPSILILTASFHDLTFVAISGVTTLDIAGQTAIMSEAQEASFEKIIDTVGGGSIELDATVAQAIAGTDLALTVADTAANIDANLDALEKLVVARQVTAIALDSGTTNMQVSAAQVVSDVAALGVVEVNSYSITLTDSGTPTLTISAASVGKNLGVFAAVTNGYYISLIGTPSLPVSASELSSDLGALVHISGDYGLSLSDSATNMGTALSANIDTLQKYVAPAPDFAAGQLTSIVLTDTGIPTLSMTSLQATSDAATLHDISGYFSVTQTATGANQSIGGVSNALGNTVAFSGSSSQYLISPSGDGVHFTVASSGSTDVLSNIQALRFSDLTLIVAQTPGTASAPTTGNITELYGAVFGRLPDVAGLAYYQNELQANPLIPITLFAQDFLASPEYTAAHSYAATTAGDSQFITDSYNNLLHRAPAAGDVAWYEANVIAPFLTGLVPGTAAYAAADTLSHAYVITDFSASPEFLAQVQVTASNPASVQHWLVLI